jgi:hypothetical protein
MKKALDYTTVIIMWLTGLFLVYLTIDTLFIKAINPIYSVNVILFSFWWILGYIIYSSLVKTDKNE